MKSFVGRSCMVFGLPLRFGRMWPLSSMLAPPEKDLNTSRVNLGRFASQLLGGVRETAEVLWKGRRMGGSLIGVTPKGKQGRNVSGLELVLLIRPPTRRATSCIQLVSIFFSFSFFWRWVAMAHNITCPWLLGSSCKKSSLLTPSLSIGIPTRAYRFCSGTGHMLKPFGMKLSTVFDSDEVFLFFPQATNH